MLNNHLDFSFLTSVLCLLTSLLCNPASGESASSAQSAFLDWGNPQNILSNGEYDVTGQPLLVGAYQNGGVWQTNFPTCWRVPSETSNDVGILSVALDRSLIFGNPVAGVRLLDCSNSTLYLDLRDANDEVVVSNLVGNLMTGSLSIISTNVTIPLMFYTNAVTFDLRRGQGEIMVFDTTISLNVFAESLPGPLLADGLLGDEQARALQGPSAVSGTVPQLLSDEALAKSDADGQAGVEQARILKPTNLVSVSSFARVIHVDCNVGDDSFDGRSCDVTDNVKKYGPKRTINAGLSIAETGSTVIILPGIYREKVKVPGGVRVIAVGRVEVN